VLFGLVWTGFGLELICSLEAPLGRLFGQSSLPVEAPLIDIAAIIGLPVGPAVWWRARKVTAAARAARQRFASETEGLSLWEFVCDLQRVYRLISEDADTALVEVVALECERAGCRRLAMENAARCL